MLEFENGTVLLELENLAKYKQILDERAELKGACMCTSGPILTGKHIY